VRRRWLLYGAVATAAVVLIAGWVFINRSRVRVLNEQLTVRGETRVYRLVLPLDVEAREDLPLVFAFHGAGDTPEQMANYTGLDRLAEEGWAVWNPTPVLFITGSEDRQVSPALVREAYDACRRQGHPSELLELPGVGHQWATGHNVNSRIWQFLSRHRRDASL
jgi:poly(3-hydroxybutyrate) depolymerase